MKKTHIPPVIGTVSLVLLIMLIVFIKNSSTLGDKLDMLLQNERVVLEQSATLRGNEVVSLIERLPVAQAEERLLVFTSNQEVCSEYTKFGATKATKIKDHEYFRKMKDNGKQITFLTGDYKKPTSPTYINPDLSYEMFMVDGETIIILQKK